MRSLLSFRWGFLLLLIGWVSSVEDCDWKMPVNHPKCEQTIKYKVHNDKQALATCLEHFPTTFVEGTKSGNEIKCTVYRQFQCDFIAGSISIFDKCYKFFPDIGEVTIKEYVDNRKIANDYCKDAEDVRGGIPVFLTVTQAKHIAMEAHRQGISKIWVNVDSNGKTIEKSGNMEKGSMLYKEPWKLHKAHYWKGKELKATPMNNNQYVVPPTEKANYLFFRSKNDHWNNLIQGSFERGTEDSKAGIVCEYQAKIVPNQKKYCDRMGDKGLGLNAKYSKKDKRCLYTTLTHYALEGTEDAIRSFPGCKETPSAEQKAGLEDATSGDAAFYTTFKDTYRFAAIKVTASHLDEGNRAKLGAILQHCQSTARTKSVIADHRQPYATYNQFMEKGFAVNMRPDWADDYPKDECSDFPTDGGKMNSNTLAIRKGLIIDIPVPVQIPAICSIQSNVDCQLHQDLCKTKDTGKQCINLEEWNPQTKLYAKCECPLHHKEHDGKCKWKGVDANQGSVDAASSCGAIHGYGTSLWANARKGFNNVPAFNNDADEAVVRNGCWMQFYAHPVGYHLPNVATTIRHSVGQHIVPHHYAGTLNGWWNGMSCNAIDCACDENKAPLCDAACQAAP